MTLLWEINRGLWILGDRIASERIATLSHDGRIEVVVEITGRTRYEIGGQSKWALSGNVLRPGDPVHDELKGSPAPRYRNPAARWVSWPRFARRTDIRWRSCSCWAGRPR